VGVTGAPLPPFTTNGHPHADSQHMMPLTCPWVTQDCTQGKGVRGGHWTAPSCESALPQTHLERGQVRVGLILSGHDRVEVVPVGPVPVLQAATREQATVRRCRGVQRKVK